MDGFDVLHPGVWFGPRPLLSEVDSLEGVSSEVELLRIIGMHMKAGDFSVRTSLQELLISSKLPDVRQQAIRLFCHTCRHEDIGFIRKLLNQLDHDDVLTVVVTAADTLSPEIVPFLFALLGEYAETSIKIDILTAINRLFPWGYDGNELDPDWLAERFSGFAIKLNPGSYYYAGMLSHPENLCKSLVQAAANARHRKIKFPMANIPTLLSIWSGEQCPAYYGDLVSDAKFESILDYVSRIAKMPWQQGVKYFYGHNVELGVFIAAE